MTSPRALATFVSDKRLRSPYLVFANILSLAQTMGEHTLIGPLGISVDDVDKACQRFEDLKCNWKKRLTDGRMKNIAFLLDPDGYWIEIIPNDKYSDKRIA